VVNPAMTSVSGWAQELVQSDIQGFMDSLKTVSVAAALAARSQRLSFGGYGSITVPVRNALANTLTEPAWVGEAGAIPLTSFQFSSVTMNRYKLAAITTARATTESCAAVTRPAPDVSRDEPGQEVLLHLAERRAREDRHAMEGTWDLERRHLVPQ
ncbi:MAG: hypothetical protein ACO3F5_09635, partial [Gemmatimonadaceae bacterium]